MALVSARADSAETEAEIREPFAPTILLPGHVKTAGGFNEAAAVANSQRAAVLASRDRCESSYDLTWHHSRTKETVSV